MKEEVYLESIWTMRRQRSLAWLARWARQTGGSLAYTVAGFGLLLMIWGIISGVVGRDLPGPLATLKVFWQLLSHPFYDHGPNDKGIAIQLASSLGRVFLGFTLGSLIAI